MFIGGLLVLIEHLELYVNNNNSESNSNIAIENDITTFLLEPILYLSIYIYLLFTIDYIY